MTKPDLEDGYLRIANELMEALAQTGFSGYEIRCLFFLLRKTYGFNKKADYISLSQWSEGTRIQIPHISRTLKGLIKRNIVTKNGNKYSLNKSYREWRELPKMVKGGKVTKIGSKVTKNGNAIYHSRQIQNTIKQKTINKRQGRFTNYGKYEPPTGRNYNYPQCPFCGAQQVGLRIDKTVKGCNVCKPEEVE